MSTKLLITHGAGKPHEIDAEVAASFSGRTADVLRQLVATHIRDPHLQATLESPRVALEEFSQQQGQAHEAPLAPESNWSGIVEKLRLGTVELGVAQSHTGGCAPLPRGGDSESVLAGGSRSETCSKLGEAANQRCMRHPADYALSPEDLREIARGRALFITGGALVKADLVCQQAGSQEAMWYWFSAGGSEIIDGLIVPDWQHVTSGSCQTPATQVLKINRQVRQMGAVIRGAGHSHGRMDVFSSGTDLNLMTRLAQERVGFPSAIHRPERGRLERRPVAANIEKNTPAGNSWTLSFDDHPGLQLTLDAGELPLAEVREIELTVSYSRLISLFSTHNLAGERYFPTHSRVECPLCGAASEQTSDDVVLHIVGPEELSEPEVEAFQEELREKLPRRSSFRYWDDDQPKKTPLLENRGQKRSHDDNHDDDE